MARILILYGTKEGQTQKIASFIEKQLEQCGLKPDVLNVAFGASPLPLFAYDGFIVASPVHASRFAREVRSWVKLHSPLLSHRPSAFISVCLGILQTDDPSAQATEKKIVADFLAANQWQPSQTAIFAGALTYSKYGWLKRWFMRRIAARAGGSTDTSRDHEYTNWAEVAAFAKQFSCNFTEAASVMAADTDLSRNRQISG